MTEQSDAAAKQPTRAIGAPGEACTTPPLQEWSEAEQWVWRRASEGRVADFNERDNVVLDPTDAKRWTTNRRLTGRFLETVLLRKPYRAALPRTGLRVVGAWFDEELEMRSSDLGHVLWLDCCRFEKKVEFVGLTSSGPLSLEGSVFVDVLDLTCAEIKGMVNLSHVCGTTVLLAGTRVRGQLALVGARCSAVLDLEGVDATAIILRSEGAQQAVVAKLMLRLAVVRGNLELNGVRCNGIVDMQSLKVGGNLSFINARCLGKVDIDSARVEGNLVMRSQGGQAEFGEVILRGAKIGGQLSLMGARCSGELNLDAITVAGGVLLRSDGQTRSRFTGINLRGAKIGGQLNLIGAVCNGTIIMDSLSVKETTFLDGAEFSHAVNLHFADIAGGLDLRGAVFADALNLTGCGIKGDLNLGSLDSQRPQWRGNARLILRNARVGAIQSPPAHEAWPLLDLHGLRCAQIGGFADEQETARMSDRPSEWFTDWLAKDPIYSPEPYEQIAQLLRAAGHAGKADAVLYKSRERERAVARRDRNWARWVGLSLLSWTIGYGFGYRYFYSLWWVLALTVAGAGFFASAPASSGFSGVDALWFSLDMLLPIIDLDKRFAEVALSGCPRYYFYVHKIMGFILTGFIVAGLSGITKK